MDAHVDRFLYSLEHQRAASRHTIKAYASDLQQFVGWCEERTITEPQHIDAGILRTYLKYLQDLELARASRARKTAALRSFFAFLTRAGTLPISPASDLRSVKTSNRLPKFLRNDQIEALLSAPDDSSLGLRDRAVLETLYASGMRAGELVSLCVEDVEFDEAVIRVIGKGNKERITLIGREAVNSLQIYLANSRPRLVALRKTDDGALFVNRYGARISDRGVRKLFTHYCGEAAAGLTITPHVLRHTFATHLLANGADLRIVQELLGHSRLGTTQMYTHVTTAQLQEVHRAAHPRSVAAKQKPA